MRDLRVALLLLSLFTIACATRVTSAPIPSENGAAGFDDGAPGSPNAPISVTKPHGYEGPDAAGNPTSVDGYGPFATSSDANWPTSSSALVTMGEGAVCTFDMSLTNSAVRVGWEPDIFSSARGGPSINTYETPDFVFHWGNVTSVTLNGNMVDIRSMVVGAAGQYEAQLAADCARFGEVYCGTGAAGQHKFNVYIAGTDATANPNVPESFTYTNPLCLLPGQNPDGVHTPTRQDPFAVILPADFNSIRAQSVAVRGISYVTAFASSLSQTSAGVGVDSIYGLRNMSYFFSDIGVGAFTPPYYELRTLAAEYNVHPNFSTLSDAYPGLMQTWAATFCNDGLAKISQCWNAAQPGDDMTLAMSRVARAQIPDFDLGNFYADFAARSAVYDFHDHNLRYAAILALRARHYTNSEWTDAVAAANGAYTVASWAAPQPWGFNVIRLFPARGATHISVALSPTDPTLPPSAVRGKLAVLGADGTTRYSDPFTTTGGMRLDPNNDTELYLTVTATPVQYVVYPPLTAAVPTTNYVFSVTGAVPAGQEPFVQTYCDTNDSTTGHFHSNGGGFVSSTATVDPNAFVGAQAQVCGNANVGGEARIMDRAYVGGTATVTGQATLANFAVATAGFVADSAQVLDRAHVQDGVVAGNAIINHVALISSGTAILDGSAMLTDYASMEQTSHVTGSAVVGGHVSVGSTGSTCASGTYTTGRTVDFTASPCP